MQQDQPESAGRATGEAASGKVVTVTTKDATRKRANGSDQEYRKTPGDPGMAVTGPRYHYPTQADDGYEMRDNASSPYENDTRNISKGSFDDKEEEMETTERVRCWINEMQLGGYNQAPAEPPPGLLADW
ncbi:hypothetical protein J4E81_010646 [Alternaria sp. BMP 2799]|nr:hypothetical protein J4E81_010646 [Alternaria sp. BMP 2799]